MTFCLTAIRRIVEPPTCLLASGIAKVNHANKANATPLIINNLPKRVFLNNYLNFSMLFPWITLFYTKIADWKPNQRFIVEVASGLEPLCPVLQTGD